LSLVGAGSHSLFANPNTKEVEYVDPTDSDFEGGTGNVSFAPKDDSVGTAMQMDNDPLVEEIIGGPNTSEILIPNEENKEESKEISDEVNALFAETELVR